MPRFLLLPGALIGGLLIGTAGLTLYYQAEAAATPEPIPVVNQQVRAPARMLVEPIPRQVLPRGPEAKPATDGHQLTGRVLDAFHVPIVGCTILLEKRAELSLSGQPAGHRDASAQERSDTEGRFRMHLQELGPWVLTLVHPDYPPTIMRSDLLLHRERPTELGDLQLHSEVGLIVLVEGLSGTPAGGARLSLQPVLENAEFASSTQRALRRAALSDASGRALFHGVAPGPYQLRVESAGLATVEIPHQQAEFLQRPLQLHVRLSPGHVLRGRLSDAEDEPVTGAWVMLTPWDGGAGTRTRSDEGGLFRLSGLSPGKHQLRAESATHRSLQLSDVDIPLEVGQLELRFSPGLEIAGTILRRWDRRPVAGARIRLLRDSLWPELRAGELFAPEGLSDRHGIFRFTSLASGRYRIEVESKGLFPASLSVLPTETTMLTEVLMETPFVLEGRLVDSHGRALSGGLIEVLAGSHDGSEFAEFRMRVVDRRRAGWRVHSDPEGRFRIENLAGGEFRLRLSARNRAKRLTSTFRSHPGAALDLADLVLVPAARIEGQALLANGEAAGRALVCLDPIDESTPPSLSHQIRADESGRFHFDEIAAGSYAMFYYYPGEQSSHPSVDYRARSLRRIQLREGTEERQDLILR